jgi:signal transduction histidine kinase
LVGGVEREVEVRLELLETDGEEYLCATLVDQTDVDRERAEWTDSTDTLAPPSTRIDHAHRLEALGHLTGSLAHDFNNLLSVILGSLEAANRRLIAGEDPSEDIQRARLATERSIETTSDILRYSRDRGPEVEALHPAHLLSELRGFIERALGEGVQLDFRLEPTRKVMVGGAQLETAVLNLIINARDAVQGEGTIGVSLSSLDLGDNGALELELLPGPHVCITVSDSGAGMTDDVKARVFEPFYTTKPVGRGTGLGLSTVRSVAQKFGGAVSLTSAVDQGTKVELYFPEVD